MKPPAQLHQDLPAVIREVLDRAPQPLTLAKLRSQLTGPFKVPPKLKDSLVELLSAGGFHQWPGGKYWNRDGRTWAEPAMISAAETPVAASKVIGAVSKLYSRPAAEALLAELIENGLLLRVPLFGGAKARLCSRIDDEAAFRAELDAARKVIEAGYRRLDCGGPLPEKSPDRQGGVPLPDGRGSLRQECIDEIVLAAIAALEPRKGLLVTAPRLYRALPDIAKTDIDDALIHLQDSRRVILHQHSNPSASDELIAGLYVGACWRLPED